MGNIQIKRVYEQPIPSDGARVLVDRIWPRGVSKDQAHLTAWMKEVAPSTELRKWFNHIPERFAAFRERYEQELATEACQAGLTRLLNWSKQRMVTLIYAAKDERHNHALVLQAYLQKMREDDHLK